MMHHITAITVVGLFVSPIGVAGQDRQAESRNVTQVMLGMVAAVESQITGIATDMSADKYSFAPTEGAFRGVRNFAAQIKHAAAVNHLVAATLLNERVTADMSDERGPDSVKTKEEVLKYLNESFAALRRAAATVNERNVSSRSRDHSVPDRRRGLN
jgi:hypothetical protein